MDAIHYDKIADKLIQFMGKLPDVSILQDRTAKIYVDNMKMMINTMLNDIQHIADWDDKGWIR